MKRKLMICLLSCIALLMFFGCESTTSSSQEDPNVYDGLNAQPDFKFNTTRNVTVTFVSIDENEEPISNAEFELYKDIACEKLIISGYTLEDGSFSTLKVLPTYQNNLYLKVGEKTTELSIIKNGTETGYVDYTFEVIASRDGRGGQTMSYTPDNRGWGTLAYEDLWNEVGDYDMNDLVVDYQMIEVIGYPGANLIGCKLLFKIRANGGILDVGYGIKMPDYMTIDTGTLVITDDPRGNLDNTTTYFEADGRTIHIFNSVQELMSPGGNEYINTKEALPYIADYEFMLDFDCTGAMPANPEVWDLPPYNPFIWATTRDHEIHLPDYPPTVLMDISLFGEEDDDSNPAIGRYWRTIGNLPWAFNIAEHTEYPEENAGMTLTFYHFVEWVNTSGISYPDWYKSLPGYRDEALIYVP